MYNLIYLLGLLFFLPRLLKKWWREDYPLFARLGFKAPPTLKPSGGPLFWVHAVSLGETKVANRFIEELKKRTPDSQVVLSTVTTTGHKEGKKGLADCCFYLPIDLSWVIRRYVKRLKPSAFFFIEGDLWYNCIRLAKKEGAKVFFNQRDAIRALLSALEEVSLFVEAVFLFTRWRSCPNSSRSRGFL